MPNTNHEIARRWFEEVWNKQRREAIAEILAADALIHDGGDSVRGAEGFYPFFDRMQASFSDIHVTIHDAITEDDRVCLRWTCAMKHTGGLLGMPPTGKLIEITGISILRIAGEKMAEGWQNWDMLGLLEQIQGGGKAATYIGAKV